jgi:hypothetical protein
MLVALRSLVEARPKLAQRLVRVHLTPLYGIWRRPR